MFKLFLFPLFWGLLLSGPARASALDDLLGTIFVKFSEQRREGSLHGCSMEYSSLIKDHTYAQGAFYSVFGSFSVTLNQARLPMIGLKVGTRKTVTKSDGSGFDFRPERPHFAYLSNDDGLNNAKALVDSIDSDTPGAKFLIFDFFARESIALVTELGAKNKINIVFNRVKGGSDISMPLDLTVVDTGNDGKRSKSEREVLFFNRCVLRVLKDAKQALEGK